MPSRRGRPADGEADRTGDGVGVGRDDAVGRGVGAVLQPGLEADGQLRAYAQGSAESGGLSDNRIEALALGTRWVAARTDSPMGVAAKNALAKIAAVLPANISDLLDSSGLLIGPGKGISVGEAGLPTIRQAIRAERKLEIVYADAAGAPSTRVIWPLALAFFDRVRVVVAWCETRKAFRHFGADRISAIPSML